MRRRIGVIACDHSPNRPHAADARPTRGRRAADYEPTLILDHVIGITLVRVIIINECEKIELN